MSTAPDKKVAKSKASEKSPKDLTMGILSTKHSFSRMAKHPIVKFKETAFNFCLRHWVKSQESLKIWS